MYRLKNGDLMLEEGDRVSAGVDIIISYTPREYVLAGTKGVIIDTDSDTYRMGWDEYDRTDFTIAFENGKIWKCTESDLDDLVIVDKS